MITLITPTEHRTYFALAKHLDKPLAELVRSLLAREVRRVERSGVKLTRRK